MLFQSSDFDIVLWNILIISYQWVLTGRQRLAISTLKAAICHGKDHNIRSKVNLLTLNSIKTVKKFSYINFNR